MTKQAMHGGLGQPGEGKGHAESCLDARLEALLSERARRRSELSGLEDKVLASLEARELAQAWLKRHGDLLAAATNGRTRHGLPRSGLLRRIERLASTAVEAMERIFRSVPLAAALGGAAGGWLLALCLPAALVPGLSAWLERLLLPGWLQAIPQAALLSAVLALAGAAAGALSSQWQHVREYYG